MNPFYVSEEEIKKQNRNAIVGVIISLVLITVIGLYCADYLNTHLDSPPMFFR